MSYPRSGSAALLSRVLLGLLAIVAVVALVVSITLWQRVSGMQEQLARQSAFRIDAELVRDNALAIAGLLVPTIGGPSVKPYQPDDYWENLNFPRREYSPDRGESQYRRGLYTWWQRTFLHPSLLAFDAPTREECAAERNRSNIPQQALVLLNDPSYVEAARAFVAGYASQAHMTDDVRRLTGLTPVRFLEDAALTAA